jgi:putative chitobiose transport system substrate-binding protein
MGYALFQEVPFMIKSLRKGVALSVATVMALGVLAGCGGKAAEQPAAEAPKTAETAKPVKIQFWTIALKPTFDNYINARISKFQTDNPTITVEWTDLPYDAMEQKLLTAIGSGEAPDVVNLNTGMALTMAQKKALVDLKKEAPETLSIYQDSLLKGATLKDGVYAYPWYATSAVLIMNTDIVTKAGLDPKNPPKNWQEMTEWAKAIRKTGKYAFMPNRTVNQFALAGIPILNEDRTKAAFNTPAAVEFLQWNHDLIEQDLIPHDSITKNYSAALDRYQAGELAFLLTGSNFLDRVKTNAPAIYAVTDVAPYILDKGNVLQTSLMNIVIPTAVKAENKAAAIKFGNFITNDESQLEFAKVVSVLPSTKKAATDPFFTADTGKPMEDKAKRITVEQMKISEDFTLGVGGKQGKINNEYLKALEAAMTGAKAPKQAIDDLEKAVNEILAQP